MIVGFPGETDDDFTALRRFVEQQRFEHMGVFSYSREEGTAAFELGPEVPAELADERAAELMAIQQGISRAHNQAQIGRELPVLVGGPSEQSELLIEGRAWRQAPDVDGVSYLTSGWAEPGTIVQAKVVDAGDYDLVVTIDGADEEQ
jgi:ribosomal protein S12 methylthiotransferase